MKSTGTDRSPSTAGTPTAAPARPPVTPARACAASSARSTSSACSPSPARRSPSAEIVARHRPGQDHGDPAGADAGAERSAVGHRQGLHGRPGPVALGAPGPRSWELPPETKELMRDLAQRQRETVNLYVARDIYRVCVAQQESPQPLRHVVHVGDELPLWAGASSKMLLRNADDAPARPDRPELSLRAGLRRLAARADRRGRGTGLRVSHGERETGLSAVAVPVLGRVRRGGRRAVAERTDRALPRRADRRVRRPPSRRCRPT